jgi:hypothetical protein
VWGLAQLDEHFGRCNGQAFARSDVKRYALPPPRIDLEFERHKCFSLRVGIDAGLVPITVKLAAYNILRSQRTDPFYTLAFSSRNISASRPGGGSMAIFERTCNKWFCTTSRSAPV